MNQSQGDVILDDSKYQKVVVEDIDLCELSSSELSAKGVFTFEDKSTGPHLLDFSTLQLGPEQRLEKSQQLPYQNGHNNFIPKQHSKQHFERHFEKVIISFPIADVNSRALELSNFNSYILDRCSFATCLAFKNQLHRSFTTYTVALFELRQKAFDCFEYVYRRLEVNVLDSLLDCVSDIVYYMEVHKCVEHDCNLVEQMIGLVGQGDLKHFTKKIARDKDLQAILCQYRQMLNHKIVDAKKELLPPLDMPANLQIKLFWSCGVDLLEKLTYCEPTNILYYKWLGFAHHKLAALSVNCLIHYESSLKAYEQYAIMHPTSYSVLFNKANLLIDWGQNIDNIGLIIQGYQLLKALLEKKDLQSKIRYIVENTYNESYSLLKSLTSSEAILAALIRKEELNSGVASIIKYNNPIIRTSYCKKEHFLLNTMTVVTSTTDAELLGKEDCDLLFLRETIKSMADL